MKHVQVRLLSTLKCHASSGKETETLALEDQASVREALQKLRLANGEVGLVVLNGKLAGELEIVPDGALLELYPVFGGG